MRLENIHLNKVYKKKQHPASKCKIPKCIVCHHGKVLGKPTKQEQIARDKDKQV